MSYMSRAPCQDLPPIPPASPLPPPAPTDQSCATPSTMDTRHGSTRLSSQRSGGGWRQDQVSLIQKTKPEDKQPKNWGKRNSRKWVKEVLLSLDLYAQEGLWLPEVTQPRRGPVAWPHYRDQVDL